MVKVAAVNTGTGIVGIVKGAGEDRLTVLGSSGDAIAVTFNQGLMLLDQQCKAEAKTSTQTPWRDKQGLADL